jgi:hypothetical protein
MRTFYGGYCKFTSSIKVHSILANSWSWRWYEQTRYGLHCSKLCYIHCLTKEWLYVQNTTWTGLLSSYGSELFYISNISSRPLIHTLKYLWKTVANSLRYMSFKSLMMLLSPGSAVPMTELCKNSLVSLTPPSSNSALPLKTTWEVSTYSCYCKATHELFLCLKQW